MYRASFHVQHYLINNNINYIIAIIISTCDNEMINETPLITIVIKKSDDLIDTRSLFLHTTLYRLFLNTYKALHLQ